MPTSIPLLPYQSVVASFQLQDHSYVVRQDPAIVSLMGENKKLKRELKNAEAREARCRHRIGDLIKELEEKQFLSEDLRDQLSIYSGMDLDKLDS